MIALAALLAVLAPLDAWSDTLEALGRGDFRGAHAAAHRSEGPDALRARGELWLRAGDDARALANADAALAQVPGDPLLLLQGATAALRLGHEDAAEYVEWLEAGVAAADFEGDELDWWETRLESRRDDLERLDRRRTERAGAERAGRVVAAVLLVSSLAALAWLVREGRTAPSRNPGR